MMDNDHSVNSPQSPVEDEDEEDDNDETYLLSSTQQHNSSRSSRNTTNNSNNTNTNTNMSSMLHEALGERDALYQYLLNDDDSDNGNANNVNMDDTLLFDPNRSSTSSDTEQEDHDFYNHQQERYSSTGSFINPTRLSMHSTSSQQQKTNTRSSNRKKSCTPKSQQQQQQQQPKPRVEHQVMILEQQLQEERSKRNTLEDQLDRASLGHASSEARARDLVIELEGLKKALTEQQLQQDLELQNYKVELQQQFQQQQQQQQQRIHIVSKLPNQELVVPVNGDDLIPSATGTRTSSATSSPSTSPTTTIGTDTQTGTVSTTSRSQQPQTSLPQQPNDFDVFALEQGWQTFHDHNGAETSPFHQSPSQVDNNNATTTSPSPSSPLSASKIQHLEQLLQHQQDDAKRVVAELVAELERTEQQYQHARDETKDLEINLQDLIRMNTYLQSKLQELPPNIRKSAMLSIGIQTDFDEENDIHEIQKKELQDQIVTKQRLLNQQQDLMKQQQQQWSEEKKKLVQDHELQHQRLQSQIGSLETNLSTVTQDCREWNTKYTKLREEHSKLEQDYSQLEQANSTLQQTYNAMNMQIALMKKSELQARLETLMYKKDEFEQQVGNTANNDTSASMSECPFDESCASTPDRRRKSRIPQLSDRKNVKSANRNAMNNSNSSALLLSMSMEEQQPPPQQYNDDLQTKHPDRPEFSQILLNEISPVKSDLRNQSADDTLGGGSSSLLVGGIGDYSVDYSTSASLNHEHLHNNQETTTNSTTTPSRRTAVMAKNGDSGAAPITTTDNVGDGMNVSFVSPLMMKSSLSEISQAIDFQKMQDSSTTMATIPQLPLEVVDQGTQYNSQELQGEGGDVEQLKSKCEQLEQALQSKQMEQESLKSQIIILEQEKQLEQQDDNDKEQFERLKSKCVQLEEELKSKQDEQESLKSQILDLEQKLDHNDDQVQTVSNNTQITKLRDALKSKNALLLREQEERTSLQSQINSLQEELQKAAAPSEMTPLPPSQNSMDDKYKQLQEQYEKLQEELYSKDSIIANEQNQRRMVEAKLAALEEEKVQIVTKQSTDHETLQQEYGQLQNEMKVKSDVVYSLEAQIVSLEDENTTKCNELKLIQSQYDTLQVELKSKDEQIVKEEEQRTLVETQLQNIQIQCSQLQDDLKSKDDMLSHEQEQRYTVEKENVSLQESLDIATTRSGEFETMEKERDQLRTDLQSKKDMLSHEQKQRYTLETKNVSLRESLDAATTKSNDIQSQCNQLQEDLQTKDEMLSGEQKHRSDIEDQMKAIQSQCDGLQHEVKLKDDMLERETKQRNEFESQIASLKEALEAATVKADELKLTKEECDKLQLDLKKNLRNLSEEQSQRVELQNQLHDIQTQCDTLRCELESKGNILSNELSEKMDLESQLEKVQSQYDELRDGLQVKDGILLHEQQQRCLMETQLNTLQETLKTKEDQYDQLQSRSDQFQNDLQSKDNILSDEQTQRAHLESQIENLESKCDKLSEELKSATAMCTTEQEERSSLEARIVGMQSQCDQFQSELQSRDDAISLKEKEKESLETQILSLQETLKTATGRLNRYDEIQSHCNQLRDELLTKSDKLVQEEIERGTLNSQLEEIRSQCDKLRETLQNKDDLLSAEKKQRAAFESQIEDFKSQCNMLRDDLESKDDTLLREKRHGDDIRTQLESVQQSLEKVRGKEVEIEELRSQCTQLQNDLQSKADLLVQERNHRSVLEAEMTELQSQCNRLQEEVKSGVSSLTNEQTERAVVQKEVEALESQYEDLRDELKSKEEKLLNEQDQRGALETEIEKIQVECHKLREDLKCRDSTISQEEKKRVALELRIEEMQSHHLQENVQSDDAVHSRDSIPNTSTEEQNYQFGGKEIEGVYPDKTTGGSTHQTFDNVIKLDQASGPAFVSPVQVWRMSNNTVTSNSGFQIAAHSIEPLSKIHSSDVVSPVQVSGIKMDNKKASEVFESPCDPKNVLQKTEYGASAIISPGEVSVDSNETGPTQQDQDPCPIPAVVSDSLVQSLQDFEKSIDEVMEASISGEMSDSLLRGEPLEYSASQDSSEEVTHEATNQLLNQCRVLAKSLTGLVDSEGDDNTGAVWKQLDALSDLLGMQDLEEKALFENSFSIEKYDPAGLHIAEMEQEIKKMTESNFSALGQSPIKLLPENEMDTSFNLVLQPFLANLTEDEEMEVMYSISSPLVRDIFERLHGRCRLLEGERNELLSEALDMMEASRESCGAEIEAALATARKDASSEVSTQFYAQPSLDSSIMVEGEMWRHELQDGLD